MFVYKTIIRDHSLLFIGLRWLNGCMWREGMFVHKTIIRDHSLLLIGLGGVFVHKTLTTYHSLCIGQGMAKRVLLHDQV